MFCNVCSREINSILFETIGNQFVCCLACVGLLESNNEDKCHECHRPVWKDNYYIIDSKNYCSEKCKLIAVKKYSKKNNYKKNQNIKHIQNEFFKNDNPSNNLQELRREARELYKEIEFDENSFKNSIQTSLEQKHIGNFTAKNIKKEINKLNVDKNDSRIKGNKYNKQKSCAKNSKKINMIPNKKPKLKVDILYKKLIIYKTPRSLSKKMTKDTIKRCKSNYSFDSHEKLLYKNNKINITPLIKNSIINSYSMNKCIDENSKKNINPSIQGYHNKKRKLNTIKIPSQNFTKANGRNDFKLDNIKYTELSENNENENYINMPCRTQKCYTKLYNPFSAAFYHNNNKIYHKNQLDSKDNKFKDKLGNLCDIKSKKIDGSNF